MAVAERQRQRLVTEAQIYQAERQRLQARYERFCVVSREGSERVDPLSSSLAQSSLRSIVEYLCGLEPLPNGAANYPAHSPDWQMGLKIEGNGDWRIASTGVVLINRRPYADMNLPNVSNPGSLLGDLADKQIP